MLEFNQRGLLIPATIIKSTLNEFRQEFAVKLKDGNRKELFNQYELYSKDLKNVCDKNTLTQWLDGSYVTLNKNPSDIDLVTFIEYDIIAAKEKELKRFIFPQSLENYKLDAYIIPVYPIENSLYFLTSSDRSYWIDRFEKTKPNRVRKRYPKGFLEIIV